MEHWRDDSQYCRQPDFNDNVFRDGNKLKRLFRHRFSNGFRWHFTECHCDRVTEHNLCWWLKYAHSKWRNILSMEHW
jgi:hypothetical protein